jgi:hypothetical protein
MSRTIYDVLVDPSFDEILEYGMGTDKYHALIEGAEQGFNERADVMVQAADGSDLNEMWTEIAATLAIRNTQRNRLIDSLTYRTDGAIDIVGVPAIGDFEPASEYGQPVGLKGGAKFNRGYDFQFYDLAVRYTWMYIAEADQAQLRNLNNQALEADNRLLFTKVLKTVFNPTNLVGTADSNIPVNVFKFYNGDGEVPPQWKLTTFAGTHSHYVTSGAATIAPAALTAVEDDMLSHGYGMQTGTKLVLWVNRQEGKTIRTFRVTGGASYDFIPGPNYGGGVYLPATAGIVGAPQGGPGMTLNSAGIPGEIGVYGPFHVVEDEYVPPGYIVCLASGGPDNLTNPVGIREHKNPSYRGLKIIPGQRSDYPLLDSYYRRGFGTGVRQRGGGYVMQITTSGTYTVPSAYA